MPRISLSGICRFAAVSLAAIATSGAAQAQGTSSTIRIEPRAYYGATVTLEQGVRVWRPLPPVKYVIVNPEGRTPLNLSLAEVNENVTSTNHYHNDGAATGTGDQLVGPGRFGPFLGRPVRRNGANAVHGHARGFSPRAGGRSP